MFFIRLFLISCFGIFDCTEYRSSMNAWHRLNSSIRKRIWCKHFGNRLIVMRRCTFFHKQTTASIWFFREIVVFAYETSSVNSFFFVFDKLLLIIWHFDNEIAPPFVCNVGGGKPNWARAQSCWSITLIMTNNNFFMNNN